MSLKKLRKLRAQKWAEFMALGGRGVELADEIDELDYQIGLLICRSIRQKEKNQ